MDEDGMLMYSDYIGRIIHMLQLYIDESLLPYEITHQQARIVSYLDEIETSGKKIHQKQLDSKMGLTSSSITSLLQSLEKKEFIRREADEIDARKKFIYLTDKGRTLNKEFIVVFNKAEELLMEVIQPEERKFLFNILKRITLHLENEEKGRMKR